MCGIAGFWQKDLLPEKARSSLLGMTQSMIHRGPDGEGQWFDIEGGMALGHRRLSIIDLSKEGTQPMTSPSGRYTLSYNGEIYNFKDLRQDLEKSSVEFRGGSDTEVLLLAIELWGMEPTLKKLQGMFAFALWDKKDKRLSLARDRVGIKPLYYGWNRGVFYFASELSALEAHPDFKAEIDRGALSLFLRHNYIPCPHSIYSGIHKLVAGSYIELLPQQGQGLVLKEYWSAVEVAKSGQANPFSGDEKEAVEELKKTIEHSVSSHMVSDVPLGSFLSGGVDSSLVTAIMQKKSSAATKTFSIGFKESGFNEAVYAKAVAEHLGTDHSELYLDAKEMIEATPKILSLCDEPFADSSQIPTYFVSQLAKKHVTVALSGDGGDELFSGYTRYFWADAIYQKLKFCPAVVRSTFSTLIKLLSPKTWDTIYGLGKGCLPNKFKHEHMGQKLHRLAGTLGSRSPAELYRRLVSHENTPDSWIKGAREPQTQLLNEVIWKSLPTYPEQMMLMDLLTYLPDDILTKVDRASMAVSLESRVPLLDHSVIEFAWTLPQGMKNSGGVGKKILRNLLYSYVPKHLIERPKMGFGIPIDAWLRGPLRDWAESLLNKNRINDEGFFDASALQKKWNEHQSGRQNWGYSLWNFIAFQVWLQERS